MAGSGTDSMPRSRVVSMLRMKSLSFMPLLMSIQGENRLGVDSGKSRADLVAQVPPQTAPCLVRAKAYHSLGTTGHGGDIPVGVAVVVAQHDRGGQLGRKLAHCTLHLGPFQGIGGIRLWLRPAETPEQLSDLSQGNAAP